MIGFEEREYFWAKKNTELKEKLKNLSKHPQNFGSDEKLKALEKEKKIEELRLQHETYQEEIQELKDKLAKECSNCIKFERTVEICKEKMKELEKNNKSLIERENKLANAPSKPRPVDLQEINKLKDNINEIQLHNQKLEDDIKNIKENYEKKIQENQSKLKKCENENNIMQEVINNLENDLKIVNKKLCEQKEYSEKIVKDNKEIEAEITFLKQKETFLNNGSSPSMSELIENFKILEEENLNLREQVEIFREDHSKRLMENNLLKQLSFIILSKDKSSLDQEASNLLKKTIGENPTKLIETFQEKAFGFEQENNILYQRVNQELQTRIDNLERIKSLQESLNKFINDPSLESEINRTKVQIISAKSALSSSFIPKRINGSELRDFNEKESELDMIKAENKTLRNEKEKIKEENYRYINLISDFENKLNHQQIQPLDSDIICFIQCEAAALEDMLADSESPDLDSDEFY